MTAESHAAPRIAAAPTLIASGAVLGPNLRQPRPVILPFATAGTVLLIWQVVVTALRVPAVILPPPVEIAAELWRTLPVLLRQAIPRVAFAAFASFFPVVISAAVGFSNTEASRHCGSADR